MSWLRHLSILTRNTLFAAVSLVVILALAGILSARALQESTNRLLAERLRLAQLAAVHIDDHVAKDVLGRLERAAASEGFDLVDADSEPERRALHQLFATGLFSFDVFVADAKGIVLLTEPDLPQVVGTDLSAHPHFRDALVTGEPQVSGLLTAIATGQPLVSFVVPMVDQAGTVIGLIGGAAHPASPSLAGILTAMRPAEAGHVDLVDRDGLVLFSTNADHVMKPSHHRQSLLPLLQSRQAEVGTYPIVEAGVERRKDVVAVAPLSAAPWAVSIEQPEAEALSLVYALRQRMILIGVIALLTTLAITWIATQALVAPIRQLLAASRRVASGDLETPVTVAGRDEITELGRGFEAMRQKLAAWGEELEAAVQERTRELYLLYTIDRVAAQSLDLEEILGYSLDKVLEMLEIEAGAIYLLEPDRETITLRVHRGLSEEFIRAVQRIKVGEGISGRAVAERKPAVLDVPDYSTARLAPFVVKEGFQSLASTPLVSKGVALGALTLGTRRPRAFPPEEMELLAAIGQQLGGAVENARLYQETQRRLAREEQMNELARALGGMLELPSLFPRLLPRVVELTGADAGAVAVLDPYRQVITYPYHYNLPDVLGEEKAPAGAGLAGLTMEARRPILLNDYRGHPAALTPWVEAGARSTLSVPLLVGDQVIGAMGLFSLEEVRPFDQEAVAVAQAAGHLAAVAIQRARLFESEQRRATQLALVANIARRVASILDPDQLMQDTADAIGQAFGYYDIILFLVDHDAGQLTLKTRAGSFERPFPAETPVWMLGDEGIIDWVVRHGQTLVANDVSQEPRYRPFLPATRSELCVPIKDGEQVVAGINIESDRRYAFDEADVSALETLADGLAVALRNAQLFEETRQKSEHLAVINRLDRVISSSLQINEVYEVFVEEVARLISFDHTSIALLDEAGEHWEVVALWTRAESHLRVGARWPVRGTLMEVLLAEQQPWIEGEVGEKGEWSENEMLRREGVRARLLLPLIAKGRTLGMLNFGSYQPHTYSERDLAVLEPIADQMAIALENARLYQAMEQRLVELGALFEVSRALSGAATAEEMLPIILDKTLQVVDAEAGAIFLLDEAAQQVVVPAARGPMEKPLLGRRFPLAGTFIEMMLHTTAPDISLDLAADAGMPEEMRAMLREGDSGVGLPLRAAGIPLGVMAVSWLRPRTVADDERRLLTAIAHMAANAIHRAGLHDKTVRQAQELTRLVAELEDTYDATLTALSAALDARDHETEGHSRRVAQLAMAIARTMGLPESEVEALMRGALLHDIGKIGVPDSILSKSGPLTDEERAQMQRHSRLGYDMLKHIKFLAPALPVVLCHHERLDGTGYPQGLRGEAIPLVARIFAVADAYDAMTSERPYRRAKSHAEARAEIRREAGQQFDPQVVDVFLSREISDM